MKNDSGNLVICENLTRHYRKGEYVLKAIDDVSFSIQDGDFASIMGPSGSGKSTLMHLLGCLDQPSAGKIILSGNDISHANDDFLSSLRNKYIGFVFQSFHLLPYENIVENVALPLIYSGMVRRDRLKRATLFLEAVGLKERLDHTPLQLSGGQCQRVAIARALVTRPLILLADEPTGNLDSRTSLEILELFQKLNEWGMTILMVTHDTEVADCTKQLLHMRDGKILSVEEIENPNFLKGYNPDLAPLKELVHAEF
ncbi:ABC transporter ATP-binding protein [Candidatus Riflebacteria bacterium]